MHKRAVGDGQAAPVMPGRKKDRRPLAVGASLLELRIRALELKLAEHEARLGVHSQELEVLHASSNS